MDNRRVLSQNKGHSQRGGLFSSVKRIFSRGNSPEPSGHEPSNPTQRTTSAPVKPLPSFLQFSHTQNKPAPERKLSIPGTFEETPKKRRAEDLLVAQQAPKRVHRVSSANDLGTPRQRILSRRPSRVSTPDYTPHYHTIANTSMGSARRVYQFSGLPSPYQTRIKPPRSARRHRSSQERQLAGQNGSGQVSGQTSANTTFDGFGNTSVMLNTSHLAATRGPKSKTYQALEAVLKNQEENGHKPADGAAAKSAQFGNPYAASGGAKRKVTAQDITKTLAYDKSTPLPASSMEVDTPETSTPAKPKDSQEKSEPVSQPKSFTFGKPDETKANGPGFSFGSKPETKPETQETKETKPEPPKFNLFGNSQTAKEIKQPTAAPTFGLNGPKKCTENANQLKPVEKKGFEFKSAKAESKSAPKPESEPKAAAFKSAKPKTDSKPALFGANGTAPASLPAKPVAQPAQPSPQYSFGSITVRPAQYSDAEVAREKHLFVF
ncbi:hypothetical protein DICA1_C09120 [Diutina catenulata]